MASIRALIRSLAVPFPSASIALSVSAVTAADTDLKSWESWAEVDAPLLEKKSSLVLAEAMKEEGASGAADEGEAAKGSFATPGLAVGIKPSASPVVGLGAKLAKGS